MEQNERVGVAVIAAVVGAAVGGTLSRGGLSLRARRGGSTRALLDGRQPIVLSPIETVTTADDRPDPDVTSPDGDGAIVAADLPPTPSGTSARRASRPTLAQLAGTISTMSVGALITLVVLWSIGTFDAQPASRAAMVDPSLPVTAADLEVPPTAVPQAPAEAEAAADTDDADADDAAAGEDVADAPEVAPAPPAPQLADPVRIEIPAIGIAADVIPLGLVPDTNELEVPTDFAQTGWWTGGPEPGEIGPAVIAGHVDSFDGPAVFYELDQLVFDDLVRITRADGSAATFAVRETIAVDKDDFPTEYVYGSTDQSVLRLITCDGDFSDGSYLGNLIVTAELLAEHPAPSSGFLS